MSKRNDPCHCGSGKKYKKCCMRNDQLPEDERGLLDPGLVPQHAKDATDKMMAKEGYTAKVSAALLVLERRRRAAMSLRRGLGLASLFSSLAWIPGTRRT